MNKINAPEPGQAPSPALVDYLAEGKCTLVAGPLISLAPGGRLGPPTPAWLAFEMAERMGRRLDNYDLQWVSLLYAKYDGFNGLRRWVAGRLSDPRYRPSLAHHLAAQLPFGHIIYTAQDVLLEKACESRGLPVSFVLPNGGLSYASGRVAVQLYGSAKSPDLLKLTEDERRQVFSGASGPLDDLRGWARNEALLFLGFVLNDPELADFYYRLRPQGSEKLKDLPRAHLVGPSVPPDYEQYWEQHNATLYSQDAATFLQSLAQKLVEKGRLPAPLDLTIELPPLLEPQERQERERQIARSEALSGLNEWVETGAELRRRFEPHFMVQMYSEIEGSKPDSKGKTTSSSDSNQQAANALSQLQSGNIEWSQGNLELARVYFEKAVQLDPQLTDAYLSLYHLLVEKGELGQAFLVYQRLIQQAPQQAFLPERYQILNILGQGNLGVSYCVHDQEQDQTITVTILRRAFALQEEALTQFARQMSALSSRRIGRFLGFDRYGGRTFMLSEYVEGRALEERLRASEPLPYLEAMQIASEVAEALEDGHRQSIPHLGLQPSNIILTSEGARLVNYGYSRLARLASGAGRVVQNGWINYLSPEQLAGKEGDTRSDVYTLGTILYQMLTGHPPGVGSFRQPSEVNLQVTEAVDVLIEHARERYTDQRFASPGEMQNEIKRISLSAQGGKPNQYVRIGLAWVSQLYERLASGKGLIFTLLALAAFLALSMAPSIPEMLSLAGRQLSPLLLNSLLVSILFDWIVRAIARRRGLGSLITSGRGMGAILGLVFTMNLIAILGLEVIAQFPALEILKTFGSMLAVVLFETALALGIIMLAGRIVDRFWKSYTTGFYWSFIAIVVLELALTLVRQPVGLISP